MSKKKCDYYNEEKQELEFHKMSLEQLEYELYRHRAYVDCLYVRGDIHLRNKDAAADRLKMLAIIERLEREAQAVSK